MGYSYVCIDEALEVFSQLGYEFEEDINSLEYDGSMGIMNIEVGLTDELFCRFTVVNIGPVDEDDELWSIHFLYKTKDGFAINKKYKRAFRDFLKEKFGFGYSFEEEAGQLIIGFIESSSSAGESLCDAINFIMSDEVMAYIDGIKDNLHEVVRKEENV